jgi:peptidoglycan/LPS O-acetylase OafA/YrhL
MKMKQGREQTFENRLESSKYRPSGFDYLRLVLATAVVLSHTINVSYGRDYTLSVWSGPMRPFLAIILPMFFALSGFLVAGSLDRCKTLVSFLGLRALRIVPALFVETILSAFFLGLIFTTLPLREYFTDKLFYTYFLNIFGSIHYFLPGVFTHNAWGAHVNNQLWTLPYELECYFTLSVLVFIGIVKKPKLFISFLVIYNIALFGYYLTRSHVPSVTVAGPILVECFMLGVAGYLYRARIGWSWQLGLLSAAATLTCLSISAGDYFCALPATYLTIYLGLMQPKRIARLLSGDYSYGIFLYGFPLQQAVAATIGPHEWYMNFLLAFPLTVGLAVISWNRVEKPALQMRPQLLQLENQFLTQLKRASRLGNFAIMAGKKKTASLSATHQTECSEDEVPAN